MTYRHVEQQQKKGRINWFAYLGICQNQINGNWMLFGTRCFPFIPVYLSLSALSIL